jgi:Na+/H+ antiporter NhaD/arsenite permease-like protein
VNAVILSLFVVGYVAIIFEHGLRVNKAASALLTAVACWTVFRFFGTDTAHADQALAHHLSDISGILFFLLGAMTIVELIDAHDGFQLLIGRVRTRSKRKLLWSVAILTFFLSAVLDNLTTAIVMVTLLRKLIADREDRWMLAGIVIIAANSGGAWSPIGDVTTTMLWIGGQVTVTNLIVKTILPSVVSLLLPLLLVSSRMKGTLELLDTASPADQRPSALRERNIIFFTGVGFLLFVPVFKTITGLPPFMGMLLGLGFLWFITELIHAGKGASEKGVYSVNHALRKIDTPSILFFLGILLSVSALEVTGVLDAFSHQLERQIGDIRVTTVLTGLVSAVVDNVPLVAAVQGMYDLTMYPQDHFFWEFLAYCAGTGGSCLLIGSAAGVMVMGIERMDFFWYLRKISWLALLGYLAGAGLFLLLSAG